MVFYVIVVEIYFFFYTSEKCGATHSGILTHPQVEPSFVLSWEQIRISIRTFHLRRVYTSVVFPYQETGQGKVKANTK